MLSRIFNQAPPNYQKSYSQSGEDMIIDFIFGILNIENPGYIDIGANEPKRLNNTYFFYKFRKGIGVLIEPNPLLSEKLRKARPADIHLHCGIGFGKAEEMADYYVMDWHEFNTFSKEIAYQTQEYYKGKNNIKEVVRLKLIPINDVMEKYFKNGVDLLSIDVEGLDLQILSTLDFEKYTPKVICAETKVADNYNAPAITDFLKSKGYTMFSQTPINGIYVYDKLLIKN